MQLTVTSLVLLLLVGVPVFSASTQSSRRQTQGQALMGQCRTAMQGKDKCWAHVHWAMTTGIKTHPEWYSGLTASSTFADFQCELAQEDGYHGKKGGACEGFFPCGHQGKCKAATGDCKALAVKGADKCWGHVNWAMTTGIRKHPEWYPRPDDKQHVRRLSVRAVSYSRQEGR
jgi:hypothetical protein